MNVFCISACMLRLLDDRVSPDELVLGMLICGWTGVSTVSATSPSKTPLTCGGATALAVDWRHA